MESGLGRSQEIQYLHEDRGVTSRKANELRSIELAQRLAATHVVHETPKRAAIILYQTTNCQLRAIRLD